MDALISPSSGATRHLLPEREKNGGKLHSLFLSLSGRGGLAYGRVGEGDASL
ncbi:hypothetical protein SAMN05216456_2899 [Devosia crocina]|uniref:Uncharacterized protein n=1 Tax=Devosia crocina TaxID=429728 RepID=A0A1I7NRT9_9HYPH|nr:hypothetical protein SAMN05216456_2899 [Devosia crocina]